MPFSSAVSAVCPECTVECAIPARAARVAPIGRLLARAGVCGSAIRPYASEWPDASGERAIQFRCSVEEATYLVRQLCALRHTSARYDTQLLTACAEAVGVIQDALGEALSESLRGQVVPLG